MKVKRKVAALLALAMVVTGQPSGVLAGAMPGDEGVASTKVVSDKIATPPKATPDEPEKELRAQVEYTILPEDGAHILNGASKKVKSGDTLKFSFVVKDDYELSSVNVDGDSDGVKISVDESDEDKYHCEYNVGDIVFDTTQVEIALTEASEEEPFSTVLTEDGLTFTITADAGVLPEGTEAEIISLEEAADIDADAVKEEVLNMADVAEEEDSQYAAYRIEFVDAEGELLADEDINGEVNVSVTAAEDEEAEIAEVYKVEVVSESEENEADEPQAYNIEEESESDKADVESTAVQTKKLLKAKSRKVVKPIINAEEVESDFEIGSSVYNLAVVFMPNENTSDAYFYIKRPEYAGVATTDTNAYAYFGKGSVPLGEAEKYTSWDENVQINFDNIPNFDESKIVEPKPDKTANDKSGNFARYDNAGFPIFTWEEEEYYYINSTATDLPKNPRYVYDFEWESVSRASGATGFDGKGTGMPTGKTWHVDSSILPIDNAKEKVVLLIRWADPKNPNENPNFVNNRELSVGIKRDKDVFLTEWEKQETEVKKRILKDNTQIFSMYDLVWYLDEKCTFQYDINAVESKLEDENTPQITLYGKFEKKNYTLTYDLNGGDGTTPAAKTYHKGDVIDLTAPEASKENALFLGWSYTKTDLITTQDEEDKAGILTSGTTMPDADKTVYAVWAADENKDGVIDGDQTRVALRPYATSIYTGGESEYEDYAGSGFPALELELKYGDAFKGPEEQGARRVNNALVTAVNINGKWLSSDEGEGINKYLEAIYVYEDEAGNYHRITNDTKYRPEGYIAVIAVKDTALKEAFSGTMENGEAQYASENGFVRNKKTGRFVTISKSSAEGISSIGVKAYVDKVGGTLKDYFVNIETSSLTIRQVNNDPKTSIRKMVDTEDEAIALNAQDLAAARPGDEGTVAFYTNGDEQRAAATEDDIRLLVDDVKDQDNRISLLEDKAFTATYGMTAEEAEAQGYDSQLKYLDLVDTGNGNAWVESATGTYVYWPYPKGTDKNTEFTLRHFVGLDRETQYDGADAVADAITDAKMEDEVYLQMEKTDEGIRFFTTGKLAFSPFILMWKTDDGNGNGGGSHDNDSTTGGSGTVADPYVVRLHGNWVHMDPNDIFKPISEPVPEGATPVTNPEWHQWKFILNNGTMLFNRWAYIRNPYAVGDQPREGWFYFNRDGIMQYGWYRDEATGKWYYAHRESDGMLGTLRYGWHHDDQDGRWYYLDPTTGEMLLGWRQIDGKWYYFNPYAPEVTWNYNEATGGWTYNGSASRPYGSMYQNEMTPDGYQVDENGAWVQ